jgi:predicted PurR-regulated permease PerM
MKQWSLPVRYGMALCLTVLMIAFLWHIRSVLQPLIIAAFGAYLLNPPVGMLARRTRLPRRAAVNLVYFTGLSLSIALPATLTPIFFEEIKVVLGDLLNGLDQVEIFLSRPITVGSQRFYLDQMSEAFAQFRANVLSPLPGEALKVIETTSMGALWGLVILVSTYLFLAEWHTIRDWLLSLFPKGYEEEAQELYRRVRDVWMNYLRGTLLLMFIVAVVFTIAWAILGIPGALALGLAAGFLTIIPDVGPAVAVLLAMAVALLEGSSWIPLSNFWVMMVVLGVYLVLINIKNLLIRPFIMGRSVHMNEGLVLVSILVATVLWGILGALLIVPVLASSAVIGDYLRRRILGLSPFPDEPAPVPPAPEPAAPNPEVLKQEETSG